LFPTVFIFGSSTLDARRILTTSPPVHLETTRTSSCNVVQDYTARPEINESLPEQSDRYGSEPTTLQRLLSTFGAMHSSWWKPEKTLDALNR